MILTLSYAPEYFYTSPIAHMYIYKYIIYMYTVGILYNVGHVHVHTVVIQILREMIVKEYFYYYP